MSMSSSRSAVSSCLSRNADWRRQAAYLREHAALPHLTPDARAVLLREAEAADRQADEWLEGAMHCPSTASR